MCVNVFCHAYAIFYFENFVNFFNGCPGKIRRTLSKNKHIIKSKPKLNSSSVFRIAVVAFIKKIDHGSCLVFTVGLIKHGCKK